LARKILLADDSVTAQNMGRKILADAGYEVIAVNNGSAALKKIAELKPDLVILDVYMPGYSGLEVCQRLKESQETARIPVLLSVGKLEPFKPEEAQRVRADAFIVKPFEASELLSALSKLEDKVVPRAEPSKPGRFARAIAAAEEADRGSRKETASDPNGWNSRIGFPHEKTEPEEKVADDSAIYNPMNRDLRTVVETAAEKAAEKAVVDVAALAPEGLPKDVTPEEVAAIAAAAAQIQIAGAAAKDEVSAGEGRSLETPPADAQIADSPVAETQISETTNPEGLEAASIGIEETLAPTVREEAKTEAVPESRIDSVAEDVAAAGPHVDADARAQKAEDLPVTMAAATFESAAAASADGSQWTAVPVALEGEDTTVSLELEMQKAYAAYAPYVAAEAESEAAAVATEQHVQEVEAATGNSSLPDVAPMVEAAPVENISAPEIAPVEAQAEVSPAAFAEADAAPAPVAEVERSNVEALAAEPAAVVEVQEAQPENLPACPEAEPAIAEAVAASSDALAAVVEAREPDAHGAVAQDEYKPDAETVKSTAAAWASWRQIRDTHKDGEAVQAQSTEFEVSEPVPADTAAMAVAAGAEQIAQEASAAPKGEAGDVASIVESVLANLRPKLMEEISRKMAEKK
jgi:twitching motility two-component system response regulator PilH